MLGVLKQSVGIKDRQLPWKIALFEKMSIKSIQNKIHLMRPWKKSNFFGKNFL